MYYNIASLIAVISWSVKYVNADVAITSPMNSVWQAGSSQFISWVDNGNGKPMAEKFDITLMSGAMTSLQQVNSIATGVSSSSLQYKWEIPTSLTTGSQYAIRIGVGSSVSYSPYFTILASGPAPANGGNTSSKPTQSAASNSTTATNKPKNAGEMLAPAYILTYASLSCLLAYI
ncbi:hypothetical protein K493DRAFT_344895 [Basidiobolus meristosporus CBS 931.73]|uniref:Yeast cell wall synthesis Kre9/Knh1-like N-terminal domain-containing protein n=1 Tax=Basidiobolus meristosporus CBS 931.73 TaxID=1314790 RepID=A0A1Y1Z5S9_9FUNG|nr:hypothetical protein K493DRAFT_344895 [Basidiobolus meristosporus CBS 931.73]|eukprot:ORY05613.1 hypothetical protein K493DRAFT_344895 [Basidiobolus meristosporus CBS 931.73]